MIKVTDRENKDHLLEFDVTCDSCLKVYEVKARSGAGLRHVLRSLFWTVTRGDGTYKHKCPSCDEARK